MARLHLRSVGPWLLLAVVVVLLPRSAHAAGDAAAAEALFRDGMTLLDAGRYEEACQKLADSQRMDPASGTLLAVALCHEKQGKTASAWVEYVDAANLARKDGRADREASARKRATELEAQLSRLTIRIAPGATETRGLEIRRNGEPVPVSVLGTALPVDPGDYVVEASAPTKRPARFAVRIAPGDQKLVDIPNLADAPSVAEPPAAPVRDASPAADHGTMHPRRIVGLIVGGVGVGSLAVAGVFGLSAISNADESRAICPTSRCDKREAFDLNRDADSAATLSNVFAGIGLVALAAGTVLFFTAPAQKNSAQLHVRMGVSHVLFGGEF